jgi:hypothetical protein
MLGRQQTSVSSSELSIDMGTSGDASSADAPPLPLSPLPHADEDAADARICRFCFEAGSASEPLLSPCACAGSAAAVHMSCLDTWRACARSPRAFYECQQCLSRYLLRATAAEAAPPPALWRARLRDFAIRDYLPFLFILQAAFCATGFLFATFIDPDRHLYDRYGAPLCRLPPPHAPPSSPAAAPRKSAAEADAVGKARADAAAEIARRACIHEFFFIAGFLTLVALAALAALAAAAAAAARHARAGRKRWAQHALAAAANAASSSSSLPPPPPHVATHVPPTPRDLLLGACFVASAFLMGGLTLAVVMATALALRVWQLRAAARLRWQLVCAYAVVDLPSSAARGEEAALALAHRRYLRALGFWPADAVTMARAMTIGAPRRAPGMAPLQPYAGGSS